MFNTKSCHVDNITRQFKCIKDEGELQSRFRRVVQTLIPFVGDILIGMTKIRQQLIADVNVPAGAHVMINNSRHGLRPSPEAEMRRRRDALLEQEFRYDVLRLNCEHFATFVRFGQAACSQIPGKKNDNVCKEATEKFQRFIL
ncbi:hypothetical protein SKAU_G00101380 [Synaphobranchus kaupii]|uniref:LRAT domain-containing protein n=1 Tax=Synaphobranchus kaupii TaxID=118154 RepID=A0A9Q1J5A2_SYNKA|nr:hypothetical protein SKAU_G00101380 [Synaphobranchus kaupii]